jgi:putative two-component system response regulator
MPNILIVDDESLVREVMGQILESKGHHCVLARNAAEARRFMDEQRFELILCDINMPGESGLDFIRDAIPHHLDTAAIMVTAMNDPMIADTALQMGVYDYIVKPFDRNGVLISVANALRRRHLEMENRAYRESLEKQVAERTAALKESMERLRSALEGSIHAMARTVEIRDPYTAGHQERVARLASAMAVEMGLSTDRIDGLRMAGLIHDVGKVSLPAGILSKPAPINGLEFELIKTHPQIGYDILKPIQFPWPLAKMVLQHHERMDGSGYPAGLLGEEILLEARILAVADVAEAMASHRPYRAALGLRKALKEISEDHVTRYDPRAVEICLDLFEKKGFVLTG